MPDQKYVIFRDQYNSKQAIVFHEAVPHSTFKDLRCVSAGFVSITVDAMDKILCTTYGDSKTLNLAALPGDEKILNELFKWY